MPQKILVRAAGNTYYVIHSDKPPYKVEAEDQEVKKIVKEAEDKLKQVFDQSGPELTSGVKLAVTELF
jgi:hypothetical protein